MSIGCEILDGEILRLGGIVVVLSVPRDAVHNVLLHFGSWKRIKTLNLKRKLICMSNGVNVCARYLHPPAASRHRHRSRQEALRYRFRGCSIQFRAQLRIPQARMPRTAAHIVC